MGKKYKKPAVKETVGSQYYVFNNPAEGVDFDIESYEEDIVQTDTVKNITVTENMESTVIKASGKDYDTVANTTSIDNNVEVVAVHPDDLAKMRGEKIVNGLKMGGSSNKRPFFAWGKVVKKLGGAFRYVWYPKCQLVENTDDIATSEESFSEQNDTLTIRAYKFDGENTYVEIDSESETFPTGMDEEKFFSKVITKPEDITNLLGA